MSEKGIDASAPTASGDVQGSVLVVGGGISGIQSSLDLADAGFKVYLLDSGLSIGGTMTKLDKTFPTNDCSMCILAPKLVYTGRHRNIEIITNADIGSVKGDVGNFQVTIKRRPRYVDMEKCNGCGDCVEHCPVLMPSEFDEGLGQRHAIFQPFPQAIPNIFAIDKDGERSPCRIACPAGLNAHAFVALASQERFAEAYLLIKESVPLPGSMGRICYHPCETECNRKDIEEPISICRIRRFIADWAYDHWDEVEKATLDRLENLSKVEGRQEPKERGGKRKVAVIGSGPAGLTAASDLSRMGYSVTIFEAQDKAGGMMRFGVPGYRLPNDHLQKEIDLLLKENDIEIRYGKRLGKEVTFEGLTSEGFEAFVAAIGSWKAKDIPVNSCSPDCVMQGIEFLKKVNSDLAKENELASKRVLVVGGGNVAMDCARSAKRLGADVSVIYRRTEEEMPAHLEEVQQAREEGIGIEILTSPLEVVENACQTCLTCERMELGEPDPSGRKKPIPIEGSAFDIPCDIIIFATGQEIDPAGLEKSGLKFSKGAIDCDPVTLRTSLEKVFSAGDAVTGPASAVEAIGAGHEAAISVDRFLNGEDLIEGREKAEEKGAPIPDSTMRARTPRRIPQAIDMEKRTSTFSEIESTYTLMEAVEEAKRCLNCSGCCDCMQCVEHCQRGAVDHEMEEVEQTLNVGAVILSPGFDNYRPRKGGSLGYGLYPNVLTSIEFERMLSASGPYKGHVKRLSDGEEPKRIAWLQCVGSRDESCDHKYCSSVCCMYAIKEAVIAKEHVPGLETHVYFMDMRSFGKDFDRYYERAQSEYGVVFRRSRIPRIEQDRATKNLKVRYIDEDGNVRTDEYDMIVLSIGLQPCSTMEDLAKAFEINLNEYGFMETDPFVPVETGRPGIYASGSASEPKDIPESVTQASAAAAAVAGDIFGARNTQVTEKEYPRERDVGNEFPRTGVFICHCGINISGVIDVRKVVDHARGLPFVAYADDETFTCSADSLERMKERIIELGLNRIVVASCTPRTHEPLFQDTLREAGLNPHLFEMVNLRDQNSWVHRNYPEMATSKAIESVNMGVAKVNELRSVSHHRIPVINEALVIGGGIAGMNAALSIADQGFKVHLLEREMELGGHMKEIFLGASDEDPQLYLRDTEEAVRDHPNIDLRLGSELEDISGYVGNFTSRIRKGDAVDVVQHGVVVVATGANPYEPKEYLYGSDERIMRQRDLERDIHKGAPYLEDLKEVVMIQCVGSRNDEHPYCSRICCSNALKNAIHLKELNPAVNVYVLYRDIRTYGFREDSLYARARALGVLFLHFEEGREPNVSLEDGSLNVQTRDHVLLRDMTLHPDRLVLSTGIVPKENSTLAQKLKVPLNADGFFSEAHMKLRPVDFSGDGIFLAGTAHSPRFIEEAVLQGKASASRASTIISREYLETKGNVAKVISRSCAGCQLCLQICPYDAIDFDEDKKVVIVNEILCQGCGACAAICPSGTSQQSSFTKKQIISMIDACLD
ncbi:MAG: FAD-dependent oxidoreductase [Candidatus Thermoplasmatota archaeon]|nr:FAD-dependent oxidoreductase [Candidatus Thermoplasmatota archaeon]